MLTVIEKNKHIKNIKISPKITTTTTAYSIVVECWLRVWEVPRSIPSQAPRQTKGVLKMVPVVSLFSTQH